ncbi:hypothetical protein Q4551_12730 [Oceanobacter sp. 5_MG-2023]|uniref:hypothetical protein n=1 Tax=Oceanobacter sp. 5_MG-2023 TaxID=3062645 RepID=UPI0026E48959|nr:hypothetical protein [Oceanobacter sp. 5_MG-2023]MDO6683154.1 hypothetical protein [Oceanobacter sp. 5_MG-2023]
MNVFFKFFLAFLCFAVGTAGALIIISGYVSDRVLFSQSLADIGAFGSFLGGCATLVASIAAIIGVNTWIKQIKLGPYFDYIWSAKVALRKINNEKISWYIFKYQLRNNPDLPEEVKDQLSGNIEKHKKEIESQFDILKDKFDHIDQIIAKNDYEWANHLSRYRRAYKDIGDFLTTTNVPVFDESNLTEFLVDNSKLVTLNSHFSNYYDFLCTELDKLEMKHSEAL